MCRRIGLQRTVHPQPGSRHPSDHHCRNTDHTFQIDTTYFAGDTQTACPPEPLKINASRLHFHIRLFNNNYAFIIYQFWIKPVLLRSLIGARERDSSLLVSFEPPANLMNITITPFFAIFLFRPKS
jgi:hypothetical protein